MPSAAFVEPKKTLLSKWGKKMEDPKHEKEIGLEKWIGIADNPQG